MRDGKQSAGFTLVEVMVASGIVVVIMGVLLAMTDQTQRLVKTTSSKVEQFQDSRVAFEAVTRRLSQASLNAFWDYQKDATGKPTGYRRAAELRFRCGPMSDLVPSGGLGGNNLPTHGIFFQAPNGSVEDQAALGALDHLINTWGYFLEVGSDENSLPKFLVNQNPPLVSPRRRFRLMELMQPSEQLTVYTPAGQSLGQRIWFESLVSSANRPVRALAENIVALVLLPRLSHSDELLWTKQWKQKGFNPTGLPPLAPGYRYDSTAIGSAGPDGQTDPWLNSKNQLPPVVQVVMVAIDEPSARNLEDKFPTDPTLGISFSGGLSGQGLFKNPDVLNDDPKKPNQKGDLSEMESRLTKLHVSYRIFSTNVSIRGAKWSRTVTK